MGFEYEIRNGALIWIRNPFTGVVSYVVDVRGKSFAFTLGGREHPAPDAPMMDPAAIHHAIATCPFCPGNESQTTPELFRLGGDQVANWSGDNYLSDKSEADKPSGDKPSWIIRVIHNLFPRVPAELTGGRNESYIVIEDPRHFIESPRTVTDLICTGQLGEDHFANLIETDCCVMRLALENPHVRSIVVRKNQGRESGASQPHVHQQIIGSPQPLPAVFQELRAERESPGLTMELLDLMKRLDLVIEHHDGVVTYASPIGTFPRSYDVMMPGYRGLLSDLGKRQVRNFADALYRILRILGPLPLDYEIHQGEGLVLHAHINARLYPYSNVAGTLNIPSVLMESAIALRKAINRD